MKIETNEAIVDVCSDKMGDENHKRRMVKMSKKVNSDYHLSNVLQYGNIEMKQYGNMAEWQY